MSPENGKPSGIRKWWWLLGAVAMFVVSFTLLEKLGRPAPTPSEESPASLQAPSPPEVRWTDDGAIEITEEPFRPSTIRLKNEAKMQELFDCVEQGIEDAFRDGTEGMERVEVWRETQRIKGRCMDSLRDLPVPPAPPQPGD